MYQRKELNLKIFLTNYESSIINFKVCCIELDKYDNIFIT